MQKTKLHRAALALAVASALVVVAGCKTKPPQAEDPNALKKVVETTGAIQMPPGASLSRAKIIAENRRTVVYTVLKGIGDPANEKLLFPASMTKALNAQPAQIQRRFMDIVGRSKRFELFDSTSSVTAEASDIVLDGMVTETTQEIQTIEGGVRVGVTRVRLSLQMKDRYTGRLLFPAPVEVVGQTGRVSGDRVVLAPGESPANPDVQQRLGLDYGRALNQAFDAAAERIEYILRPMAQLKSIDGNLVTVIGGSLHGFQGGDELVIFSSAVTRVGSSDIFTSIRPSLAVRCDGVAEESSQCVVTRRDPAVPPKINDFAVITDLSIKKVRER